MEQRLHCCHGTMIKSCTENLIFFRNVSGISKLLPSVAISAKKNWSFSWTTGFLKLLSGVSQGVWNCVFVLYTFLTLLVRKHKEKKSSVIDNISTSAQRKEKLWNLVLKKDLMTYHRKRLATQSLKYCKCALNNATRGSPKKYRKFYESKQLNARATDSFIYEFEEIYPQILSKNRSSWYYRDDLDWAVTVTIFVENGTESLYHTTKHFKWRLPQNKCTYVSSQF